MGSEPGSLAEAADELYGTDPASFVSRRTELVKQARAGGDKALAAQIAALRRPTVAAWYLNLLARAGTPELDSLLELGATMREAQSRFDMTAVTSLAAERQKRETAVLRRLDVLLAGQGISPSAAAQAEVARTLTAVVADAAAAEAVRSGCLARSLEYAGFGDVDLSGALGAELEALVDQRAAGRGAPTRTPPPVSRPEKETRDAAGDAARERRRAEARDRYERAVEERRDAEREVAEIALAHAAAQERLRTSELAESEARSALEAAEADH